MWTSFLMSVMAAHNRRSALEDPSDESFLNFTVTELRCAERKGRSYFRQSIMGSWEQLAKFNGGHNGSFARGRGHVWTGQIGSVRHAHDACVMMQ